MSTSQELATDMYESFYGLTEKPFTLLPDPDYLYLSQKHQRALTLLEYSMMNQAGFSVICGDTGAGKTTLIRRLLVGLGDDTKVGLITNTHHAFGELLNWVLMAFGLDGEGQSKAQMHQMFIRFLIEQYAQKKHTVLIVDEAQNMNADTLEELRMLSNINADKDQVLQVILAGQPALRETLRQPELMQFAQRIAVDYYLESLSIEETNAYIHHRLKVAGTEASIFTEAACEAIYKYSGGTPRLINLLCDTALVYGFAEQNKTIGEQLIHDVVSEQHSNSIIPAFNTGQPAQDSVFSADNITQQSINQSKTEIEQKANAQRTVDKKQEEKLVSAEQQVIKKDVAEISKKLFQQARGVEQLVPVVHSESQVNIEKVHTQSAAIDESNVRPIKATRPSESKTDEFKIEDEGVQPEGAVDSEGNLEEGVSSKSSFIDIDKQPPEASIVDTDAAPLYMSQRKYDEDVYHPMIHIEEGPGKGLNMIIIGVVGGMFIASLIMMIAAWMMFGSRENTSQQEVRQNARQQPQWEVENRELKALQKERDAAIAVTRALERERDAAITTARVQEEIRAAEMRAAEILAAQEQRAEVKLTRAKARIREAERAESRALVREREMQRKAERKEAELKSERLNMFHKEQARLEVLVVEKEMSARRLQAKQVEQKEVKEKPVEEAIVEPDVKSKIKEKAKKRFSSNPCNSPSAKFLSTCKK